MKKVIMTVACASLLLSGCTTYTGVGAYQGSGIGAILGSAIGGLTGGPRGSDWGQIVGLAGGAAVGAAIGNAAENAQQRKFERYHDRVLKKDNRRSEYADNGGNEVYGSQFTDSGYDETNSGDDRFEFQSGNGTYGSDSKSIKEAAKVSSNNTGIEISNIRFVSDSHEKILRPNSSGKIIFEIRNVSEHTVFNVKPVVMEVSGNKHVVVSPSVCIESIANGSGVKYTAMVVSDKKLKDGMLNFDVSVNYGRNNRTSNMIHLDVETLR